MKQYLFDSGPHKNLAPSGPGTPEEFDAQAGPGACLDYGMSEAIYRGYIPNVLHPGYLKIYEKVLGKKPNVDAEKTAKARANAKEGATVSDKYETTVQFVEREYELATDEQKATLNAEVVAFVAANPIDVSPTSRSTGPGKQNLEMASAKLAQGVDATEETVAKILAKVPSADIERDGDGKPTVDSLARAIKMYRDAVARELMA